MEPTDHELVLNSLKGDQNAFAELVTRYKKLIYSVVNNILNDQQETNDVSQEVFIRIYKSLDKYNAEYKFSTWCVRITTNLCLDILRKKKLESVPIEEIEGMASSKDTPEARYVKKEQSERVRKAISELPEKYRIIIVLFHQNGLSYDEITRLLNEPMSIVKNRLYRARLMLREKLSTDSREGLYEL